MAVRGNIVIDQGADYEVNLDVKSINDIPANLSGFTSSAQMRKYYTSSRFYSFDTSVAESNGVVTLSMTANTTNDIPYGRYVYDCEMISPEGKKTRIIEGIVTVKPQVTKD